ncbi:MAG TPA: ABC transporter permease [Anaerolineales bacterium]|nr:ABC transporter permease [Anaerolineales bacterium]
MSSESGMTSARTWLGVQPRARGGTFLNQLRSFAVAAWLGWQIESNWADVFLFAVYSVTKPIAGAAILVIMYSVITRGDFDSPLFAYIYLGNAFYTYVGSVMGGISWTIIDDRERYKMLKYVYVSPIRPPVYLIGRGVARFLAGTMSVLVTIVAGVLFLHLPLVLGDVNWPMFLAALGVGVAMLAMLGLLLAGVVMLTAHHMFLIGEAVAGALFLFSGAVFPLDVLPAWLRPIGFAMPLTYWLELLRRSLVQGVAQAYPTLSRFSDAQLFGILIALTALFTVVALVVFRWCDHQARERGLIDRVSNY